MKVSVRIGIASQGKISYKHDYAGLPRLLTKWTEVESMGGDGFGRGSREAENILGNSTDIRQG